MMGCCGSKRSSFTSTIRTSGVSRGGPSPAQGVRGRQFSVYFQYMGTTALTVQGPVSGRRYRFPGPGTVVEVDLRDRASLAAVPRLRQVESWRRP